MDPSSINYYNILHLPPTATFAEIKKARNNLARKIHSDKGGDDEIMKAINNAFAILSDPSKRAQYDNNREGDDDDYAAPPSGYLHVGKKWSEEYKAKIEQWEKEGVPFSDRTRFKDPNLQVTDFDISTLQNQDMQSKNSIITSYQLFLASFQESVESILAELAPEDILCKPLMQNYIPFIQSFVKTINRIPPSHFTSSLPNEIPRKPSHPLPYENKIDSLLKQKKFTFPNVKSIKNTILRHLETFSTDLNLHRKPAGTKVFLCPFTTKMENNLGYIPTYSVASLSLDTDSAACSGCKSEFNLFLWRNNCLMCGSASCKDCLQVRQTIDYGKPVPICDECGPKIHKNIGNAWLDPLLSSSTIRKKVTPQYLALLDEFGYASKDDFKTLSQLFMDEGRYDLAIQCTYSGKGDWLSLATKFAQLQKYSKAKLCLSHIKNEPSSYWKKLGYDWSGVNIEFSILCYLRANLSTKEYIVKAIHSQGKTHQFFALTALRKSSIEIKHVAYNLLIDALAKEDYSLAIQCLIKGDFSRNEWIGVINDLPIKDVAIFLNCIHKNSFDLKMNSFRLKADRDHLRWPYLGETSFDTYLDYLIELLKDCDGANCIPYFQSIMSNENFVIRRDEYFDKSEFHKAILCHLMISDHISLEELGEKRLRRNDSIGALFCFVCDSQKVLEISLKLYNKGLLDLALACGFVSGNFDKVVENAKKFDLEMYIKCQVVLCRLNPTDHRHLLNLCQTLMSHPSKILQAQKLLIAKLKEIAGLESLVYHKILAETPLPDQALLGLLLTVDSLENKKAFPRFNSPWQEKTLALIRTNIENLLFKAISETSVDSSTAFVKETINLKETLELLKLLVPSTVESFEKVLQKFDVNALPRGPQKSLCLIIRVFLHLRKSGNPRYLDAMNDIMEAILGDPRKESLSLYEKVVAQISSCLYSNKVRGKSLTEINPSTSSEFKTRLHHTPDLKLLLRTEKEIGRLPILDAAYAYIDLCMGLNNGPGLVSCFLASAHELLKAQSETRNNVNKCFAYRRGIMDLVRMAYSISHSHLCPTSHLYCIRTSIAILTSSFKQFRSISELEQNQMEELYKELDELSRTFPVIVKEMVTPYDLIFVDLVNREFLTTYLPFRRDSSNYPSNAIYQYYIFEGTWKGWLDSEKFQFDEERINTMKALLDEKGNQVEEVEALMNWPVLSRNTNGWRTTRPTPLKLEGPTFSGVEGIRFNIDTGEISLLLKSSDNKMEGVFNMSDVAGILKNGITGAEFTLDPPESESSMHYHPFQEMLYAPKCLPADYVATLLHADILLKELSMMTEISSEAPFELRDINKGLTHRLPEKLKKKFENSEKKMTQTAGKIHRFWIEAGELVYYTEQKDNILTYKVDELEMFVKTHRMKRTAEGKLVDTDIDEDTRSPEAKFAKRMTKYYKTLGKYFPELIRLRELAKLQALSAFAQNLHANVKKEIAELEFPREKIESHLDSLRQQFTYPAWLEIEEKVDRCLRQNGVSSSELSSKEMHKLRTDLLEQCEEQDLAYEKQIAECLRKSYGAEGDGSGAVRQWLIYGEEYNCKGKLIDALKSCADDQQKSKLMKICKTFENLGIAIKTDENSYEGNCSWVPAAFNQKDNFKVYGGVRNVAPLINGGPISNGGPVGSGSSGKGFQHVVNLYGSGYIEGTTTCVDRVTGNTYTQAIKHGSCVRDQWNQNNFKPNISAYMQSYVEKTDIKKYTHHTNDAVHIARSNGYTDCTNAEGKTTTYSSNNKNHRCPENDNFSKWNPKKS